MATGQREVTPDFKAPPRVVDPAAGREKVRREGRCRVCRATWPLTRAHLVAKGRGGDDVDANLVPLCGSGTTGCHGAFDSLDPTVSRALWSRLTPEEHSYILSKEGEAWAERRFRLRTS